MAVALCAAIAALAVLSLLGLIFEFGLGRDHVKGFVPMFRLSMERNVPTVFSTLLLFSLSGVLFLVGEGARARKDSRAAQWRALAVIALLLAFDEGGHIHELLDEETAWIEWLIEPSGAFAWPWVIAYACLTVAVSLFFLPLFLSLPTRYRVIFGTAAALFVSGALGLDMLEAQAFDAGRSPLLIEALCSLEEVMEMSAVAIALCGLAAYAEETFGWRRVAFLGDQPA
ncbi:MAG: hypothetical protein AAFX08_10600 [Pseudomonadota bacterium]